MLGGIGAWVGRPDLTLELMLGWAFSPLAFLLGVPWSEAVTAGSFIGQKLVVNEFVAYLNLAPYLVEGAAGALSPKTAAIVSFALCGFANLSSIAILLGGLGGMAPSRRKDIAKFGLLGRDGRHHVQPDVGHHCRPVRRARMSGRNKEGVGLAAGVDSKETRWT